MPDSYLYLAIVASTVGVLSGVVSIIAGVVTIRATQKTQDRAERDLEIRVTRTVKPHRRLKRGRKRGKHRRR